MVSIGRRGRPRVAPGAYSVVPFRARLLRCGNFCQLVAIDRLELVEVEMAGRGRGPSSFRTIVRTIR